MTIKGVILDLDGVILSTDNFHYLAWKKLADREKIYFDRKINDRLRGVSRMESLEIILEKSQKEYSEEEKNEMAEYKNTIYRESLKDLSSTDIFPGVIKFLNYLDEKKIKMAIGSSSKNTKFILTQIDLFERFAQAISDGTNISHSKPDPEVFLKAAVMLKLEPQNCLVIEDADAGIDAAKRGGMMALGVGPAKNNSDADIKADSILSLDYSLIPWSKE